ncbi:MAG: 16S rRNA (uracil(1498)-N(3))-methyltransferase [Clostridia bacterium]|nr:16S rRNA (uracil(1498)-N(3))-methyltransferase [Clostridia bacterium]MBQ3870398.1 16S rRNA (uracil(1498)-N(3))-methyltransferase [Clostridia bacterium]
MTRIFITKENVDGETVVIKGADSVHLCSALRVRPGEKIVCCDGEGTDYLCVVTAASPQATVLKTTEKIPSDSELPCRVRLYQSLPKGDKFEFIIQKAAELGVYSITPVISERCISRPDEASLRKKLVRWQTISREAAQQSGRGVIPEICAPVTLNNALGALPERFLKLFCYEDEKRRGLKEVLKKTDDICVFVGPEGGYSKAEAEAAENAGLIPVSLGRRILRTETAPLFVLSSIIYEMEL